MQYVRLFNKNNSHSDLETIAQCLNNGGVAIIPTDTTYALACHALKQRAIERICAIKNLNPAKHRFSIMSSSIAGFSQYVRIDNQAFKIIKQALPGPYTFILPASSHLPKIYSNRKEVGIRIPDNRTAIDICNEIDAPILVSTIPYSDNQDSGYLTNPELIAESLENKIDLMVDAGEGGTEMSTVISCIDSEFMVLRQGKGSADIILS
ncbi:MAG: threonylcarbamoyl-AMP synthase [Bacteroidaceae bacterium]|nr:threonylcarbamoyl-AMP synthase [Bacteroidaceae bacterium]